MEFKAITTQEQLDAVISERLKRERESIAKKYEDYDNLKTKANEFDNLKIKSDGFEKQVGELSKSIKKQAEAEKTISDLQSKVKGYETSSLKMRIAQELGLPLEIATRLSGESEDDIKADATTLSKLIGKGPVAPLKDTEQPADSKATALRSLTQNLTKGE